MISIARSLRIAFGTHWNRPFAFGATISCLLTLQNVNAQVQPYYELASADGYSTGAAATEEYSTSAIELEVARLEATNQAMLKSVSAAKQAATKAKRLIRKLPRLVR